MKKIFRIVWNIISLVLICSFIISCLSSFIPPSFFFFIGLFGLAFPYLLAAYLLLLIISLFTNRKKAIIMLVLLPLCWFNTSVTFAMRKEIPWQTQKDSSTLRVMTWNVQSFANYLRKKQSKLDYRTNKAKMLETIAAYNPDVLCIQEYRNIENAKRRVPIRYELDSLGYKYHFCSNDRVGSYPKNPAVRVEEGVAIYSKYPIIDSARVNINHSDKNENLIHTDILFNNKPVRIFTAHLQSFTIYGDTTNNKYGDDNIYEITYKKRKVASYKISETEVKHEDEVKIIRNEINKSPYPVVYCGDLNITPTSYNYHLLRGKNLQDAFLQKGSGIGNTFYKIGPTLRIDVCLPDTAMQVTQCKREMKKLSDHYPVIADMKWK